MEIAAAAWAKAEERRSYSGLASSLFLIEVEANFVIYLGDVYYY